jgi:hypothetical protein
VACIGVMRNTYIIVVRKLEERDCLEDTGVDEMIILTWILKKGNVGVN